MPSAVDPTNWPSTEFVPRPARSRTGWDEEEGNLPLESTWVSEERWRDDIALEMWVEVEPAKVTVRLGGSLDDCTVPRLRSLLQELLAAGSAEVVVAAEGVRFGHGTESTLAGLMALFASLGVTLSRDDGATWRRSVDRLRSIAPIGQDGTKGTVGSE